MPVSPDAFEKLGLFYLGAAIDRSGELQIDHPILYDARDLTTHAVALGMTGSGKTGLGIALIEEALLDGVPVIAIDPKGDMGNLLLQFPGLSAAEFEPWIDEGEASRNGRTRAEHAHFMADLWRKGLADWGEGPARIEALKKSADFRVYTPGSSAGRPLSPLASLSAPSEAVRNDAEALRDRVSGSVAGLLTLVGVDADTTASREAVLLAAILGQAWQAGNSLDFPGLIRQVQSPSMTQIGVFDLETFYPGKDRFAFALKLNAFLASPAGATWMQGEGINIGRLLAGEGGKPALSVISIAHLDEQQRMFFVTLLLNELLAWSRTQPGTTTLRAILYMDELFGYLPPVAMPPSKKPLLSLLKQARASGLGLCLATQNPADLDYKALSNIGTWFMGRLQTERDKIRVLDGLEQVGGEQTLSRSELGDLLSGLDKRQFLVRNVHEDAPVLMQVRWVMSYLAGPLNKSGIQRLGQGGKSTATQPEPAKAPEMPKAHTESPPALPPGIQQRYLRFTGAGSPLYRPTVGAHVTLHFANAGLDVDSWTEKTLVADLDSKAGVTLWDDAVAVDAEVLDEAVPGARFAALPAGSVGPKSPGKWQSLLKTTLYKDHQMTLWRCSSLKLVSTVGETREEFAMRVNEQGREARDLAVEKLRARYTPKLQRLGERIRTAEQRVEKEEARQEQQAMSTAVSIGSTVIGALFGRKLSSAGNISRAGAAIRSASRASGKTQDIRQAREKVDDLVEELGALNEELQTRPLALKTSDAPSIEEKSVAPRKADISISGLGVVWKPWILREDGVIEKGW